MPLNLSPLCNFLPKKFNTLKLISIKFLCLSWSITALVTLTNFQIDFSIHLHGGKKVQEKYQLCT